MVPPSPETIEDPSLPIKLIADGPPRPLIRTGLPDKPPNTVIAANTGSPRDDDDPAGQQGGKKAKMAPQPSADAIPFEQRTGEDQEMARGKASPA